MVEVKGRIKKDVVVILDAEDQKWLEQIVEGRDGHQAGIFCEFIEQKIYDYDNPEE